MADYHRTQKPGPLEVLDSFLQVLITVKQIYIPVNVDTVALAVAFS